MVVAMNLEVVLAVYSVTGPLVENDERNGTNKGNGSSKGERVTAGAKRDNELDVVLLN